ncbi:murein hydrolase activator EnvC family protein [Oceanospirillum sediminis]|uniref:Peptidoglycan DD-metalloendopeptidase family protein n=1 Tax=Oceanospirillum sediminis TaxID=2760088 RepID=A0A839IR48_9GAMM|nr:peptidoglycan DD-metalloendopeptidase family protein [Oceanospirillum sediminis]
MFLFNALCSRSYLTLSLTLLLGLATPVVLFAEDDRKASKEQLEALNQRIKSLEKSLNQIKGTRAEAGKKLRHSEKLIAQTARSIRENISTSEKLQQQLKGLKVELVELKKKENIQKSLLERQIRAAYAMGRQEHLKVLLNQQQPDRLARVMRYYDYINRERGRRIDDYVAVAEQKRQVETEVRQKEFSLQGLRTKLEEKQQHLEKEQKNHEQLVAQLDKDIKGKDSELSTLNQNRQRLEQLLKEVQAAAAAIRIPKPKDTRPFTSMKKKLNWPLKGRNRVRYTYGSAEVAGKLKRNGMVIAADEGQDVNAIHSGRVVFADWLRGYGVLLILDHGNGYMSLYGYNQTVLKSPGDWVNSGELIATAGRSGGQSSAGLYLEIRRKGRPIDPLSWLTQKRRG